MMRLACERFRARRKPGTAIDASRAMIATTIMISTRVKPEVLLDVFILLPIKGATTAPMPHDNRQFCFVVGNSTARGAARCRSLAGDGGPLGHPARSFAV